MYNHVHAASHITRGEIILCVGKSEMVTEDVW